MTDFGFLNSYLGSEMIQGKIEIKMCQMTRLFRMVVECTRFSVKTKSSTYQIIINKFN